MGLDVNQIPTSVTVTNNAAEPVSLAGFYTVPVGATSLVIDMTKFTGQVGLGGVSPRKAVWQGLIEATQITTGRSTALLTLDASTPSVSPDASFYDNHVTAVDTLVGIRNTLPGYTGPRIMSVSRNANSYVLLTLDRPIYHVGRTALVAGDMTATFAQNGDTATDIAIASVQTAAGGALAGGETVIRVNLTVTGTSAGLATVALSFKDSAVSDTGLPVDGSTFPTIQLV